MSGATTAVQIDGKTYHVPDDVAHKSAAAAPRSDFELVDEPPHGMDTIAIGEGVESSAHGIYTIAIGEIVESSTNPRRDFGDLQELADSISKHGVLMPILVSPDYGADGTAFYRLVCGARRLRAAKLAGLERIAALVRLMGPEEIIEAQLVENCQRLDVTALEEADCLRNLHEQHGYSVDRLVERVGKSKAYVYARLKLAAAGPEARAALESGAINASVALLIARHPLAEQKRALEILQECESDKDLRLGFRDAAVELRDELTCDVARAPFDRTDCALCPSRGANCEGLFEDVDAHVCTDRACYNRKAEEAWQVASAAWRDKGLRVLTRAESRAAMPNGTGYGMKGYVDSNAWCPQDPKRRTYKKLLGKRADEHLVIGVRVEVRNSFDVIELLPTKVLKALLAAAGHDFEKQRQASSQKRSVTPNSWQVVDRAVAKFAPQVGRVVEQRADSEAVWRWIAGALVGGAGYQIDPIARGWLSEKDRKLHSKVAACIEQHIASEPLAVLLGMIAEQLTGEICEEGDFKDPFFASCGLEPLAVLKAARKELTDELGAKAEKAAKLAAKKKPAKKKTAKKKTAKKPAAKEVSQTE